MILIKYLDRPTGHPLLHRLYLLPRHVLCKGNIWVVSKRLCRQHWLLLLLLLRLLQLMLRLMLLVNRTHRHHPFQICNTCLQLYDILPGSNDCCDHGLFAVSHVRQHLPQVLEAVALVVPPSSFNFVVAQAAGVIVIFAIDAGATKHEVSHMVLEHLGIT